MSRIIMLVPLDEKVSLTTVSLSIISFLNKKFKKNFFYFPIINLCFDNTLYIIKKHFSKSIDISQGVDFLKENFESNQYFSLIDKMSKIFYDKRNLNELIFITGIRKNQHIYADKINCDIACNIGAEVIFLENLQEYSEELFKKKEEKINCFLKEKKYKNILGIIFNNINSPFIKFNNNFLDNLNILRNTKKNLFKNKFNRYIFLKNHLLNNIVFIPWNKSLIKPFSIDICRFLNAHLIKIEKIKNIFIKKIVIFDKNYLVLKKQNYSNVFILVDFSRVKELISILSKKIKKEKISGVLLTGVFLLQKNIIKLLDFLINKKIPIFFTKENTIEVLTKLQTFNFSLKKQSIFYIKKVLEYISRFFDKNDFFIIQNKKINYKINYSPKRFCYQLTDLSRKCNKRIILPESYEPRILKAASFCYASQISQCVLLGDPKIIYSIAFQNSIELNKNIEIINPEFVRNKYISRLLELRKNKGINENIAEKILKNNTFLATLILESGQVDGLVSGAVNTTADTIRPALQIIKTDQSNSLVSSIFFMLFPDKILIYGDCAINIDPNSQQLANIAIQSSNSAQTFGIEPRIAMLSYSTGYSGKGVQVEKVRHATSIVKTIKPHLIIDGPIQYDAAISKKVAQLKTPNSSILGDANILIFPDLNSGNITYKAVQRSLNLVCLGPMLQGLKKPVNDLSRGASVTDIVYTIALTSIQSNY
ncbi:phosphate acetyltransferase [Buchnera aphidicola (Melanaphis sacchari)]|uniref:Phosphate acetyltransferase n=1 Tax=Buchnera aphidicola (Melanaphis sacchari) TaxID=2173854 RepID=A0A2U8DH58_9GAMM|nr:phosphate acetyltransferase [Buchnera aphidicola]AWH90592.1 phosphate acetyltransferase [Buchnera aphidicola (Melanaphis sacchari)]